jgi:hypothetical protein
MASLVAWRCWRPISTRLTLDSLRLAPAQVIGLGGLPLFDWANQAEAMMDAVLTAAREVIRVEEHLTRDERPRVPVMLAIAIDRLRDALDRDAPLGDQEG